MSISRRKLLKGIGLAGLATTACPYDHRFFYWDDRKDHPQDVFIPEYSPEYPLPPIKGTVNKCILCEALTRGGRLPACIAACPRNAMYFGDLESDVATNGMEDVSLQKNVS